MDAVIIQLIKASMQHLKKKIKEFSSVFFFQFLFISTLTLLVNKQAQGQQYVKIAGHKTNYLDKEDKKQGDWIFFNSDATIALTCHYRNDTIISPITFYKNKNIAFIRYPEVSGKTLFEAFINTKKILGYQQNDSLFFENDLTAGERQYAQHYLHYQLSPVYLFAQSDFSEEFAMRSIKQQIFSSQDVAITLDLNAAGKVTKVIFPPNNNTTTYNNQKELEELILAMPRWQPMFSNKNAIQSNITITQKRSTSVEHNKH